MDKQEHIEHILYGRANSWFYTSVAKKLATYNDKPTKIKQETAILTVTLSKKEEYW